MSKKDPTMEKEEELEDNNKKEETQEKPEVEALSPEEEAQAKLDELNNKYLRLYSEFENFRKRTQKEKVELYKTAGEGVISAILPVLDDFERAQVAAKESDDIKGVKEGVNLIHDKLLNILKQKGLEAAKSSIGKKFNVEEHEAITQIPAPTKKQVGKIIDEVEKGYQLNGKVIRYAKVVVGK